MKAKVFIMLAMPIAVLFITGVIVAQQQTPPPDRSPHPPDMPFGQGPPNGPQPPNPDPLAHDMFPPDLIMGHARELGLTEEQKTFMRGEITKTTASFQELQWKLQDQMELLHETLKSTSVNEQQALAQLDKVLDLEREVKRLHIGLAVRLKNRLTPEQQDQLRNMRTDHHLGMGPGPGEPPHPVP